MRVYPLTDHPERFLCLREAYLGGVRRAVRRARLAAGWAIVHLEGIDSREEAASYRGQLLEVDPGQVPPLPSGEFYWFQLEGLRVLSVTGRELGRVVEVLRTPAHDVLVVAPSSHGRGGAEERLVPFTREFVTAVDLEGRQIRLRDVPEFWSEPDRE